ncbi:MAG: hypothetical protein IT347_08560 [Candidatus Eisenbacteria bacterium]|nr:hypothetical protein [Candidatus Eisenbacteria bacterium]
MRTYATRTSRSWLAGTVIFLVLFWLVDLAGLRAGVPDPLDDSWEYGAVARSLLAGHGFHTPVVHPPLWSLRDTSGSVPVLVHGPLVPVLLAPLVALAGPGALDHLAWLAALFAVLAALALRRLGERWHTPPTGTAAALAFTLSPLTLRAVHHDLALVLGAWLLALALEQLARTRPRGLRAGLALGAGLLVRPEFLLALPLLALLAGPARRRFVLVALAPLLPWMWHGWMHAGSPLFNLSGYLLVGYWGARPEISVMRDFAIPPRAWPQVLADSLAGLPGKWLVFFPRALKRVLLSPSDFTGWLAPIGALLALQAPASRVLAMVAAALAMLPLAIMTVTLPDPRYVVPFLPVFALGAARGAAELVDWLPPRYRGPRAWMTVLTLLLGVSELPALAGGWREGAAARARLARERSALASLPAAMPGGNPVFSDTPDFVAWTLRRPALWVTREEYAALPEASDSSSAPADRPARRPGDVLWFHAADGRGAPLDSVTTASPAEPDAALSQAPAPVPPPTRPKRAPKRATKR